MDRPVIFIPFEAPNNTRDLIIQVDVICDQIKDICNDIMGAVILLSEIVLKYLNREYEAAEALSFLEFCHKMSRLFSTILKTLGEESRAWIHTWNPGRGIPTRLDVFKWLFDQGKVGEAFEVLTGFGRVLQALLLATPDMFWARVEGNFEAHGLSLTDWMDGERASTTSPEEVELAMEMLHCVTTECATLAPSASSPEIDDLVQRLSNWRI